MCCLRILFGLSLVLRTAFHLMIAFFAAVDLKELNEVTSGTLTKIALKLVHASVVVQEVEIPLVFYVMSGLTLLVLCAVYPWRESHRPRLAVYAILHILYVGMVVYVVYGRTIVSLSILRDVYQVMDTPWLYPISLLLDVLTFIFAIVSVGKNAPNPPYITMAPLHLGTA